MLELHIENYKEFLETKTEIISNEQYKIVEYEQLLLVKKAEQVKRSFLKKFFDKNEHTKVNEIIEAIQSSTHTIEKTKKEIEERKVFLIEYGKNAIIASNDANGEKNRRLLAEKEACFEINRVTKEIEDICIMAIKALENGIRLLNELNVAYHKGLYEQDYNVYMVSINKNFGEAIATVSRFKKAVKYSKDQMLNYDPKIDTSFYEPLINIIDDDNSESIVLQENMSSSNKYIPIVNNTLAVIHASYKLVKNLNEKHTKRYKEKEAEVSNYTMDIELITKKMLKDSGIKL
jgi:uncharacterized protein YerC